MKKKTAYQRKINASIPPVFVNTLDPYFEDHYAWDLFDFYEVGPNYTKWMYPSVCSTWCLVANKNTKEFHRDHCTCAKKIYPENKVYLKGGVNFASSLYDGCAFCQCRYHTPGF